MKRRWKVLAGVLVVLAVVLALNMVVVDQQTKDAEATVDGAQVLSLPGGDLQVKVDGPTGSAKAPRAPIVLIHCYRCSMRWWDDLVPLLDRDRRVIRVDLLGHGGSEKPSSGYSISDQAELVAGALSKLDVQGAVVVGQSMGAAVAVSLAEQSSQLVDRVVDMSLAAGNDSGELPLLARLGYVPVLGEAMYRLTPDFAIRGGFKDVFAPGFEVPEAFEDVIVDDYHAMTYTSFEAAHDALEDYRAEEPLDARMRDAAVPLMAMFGADDQIVDPEEAAAGWRDVPGVQITTLEGVGHTMQVEAPEETAAAIERFARDAGDEISSEAPPREIGLGKERKGRAAKQGRGAGGDRGTHRKASGGRADGRNRRRHAN